MSVLVKGMKKPENCIYGEHWVCPFIDLSTGCLLQKESYSTWEEQYAGCPLVEIHTPHDPLIDEFVEYVEDKFEVSVAVEETSDCDTFDKIFGALPEQENE